MRGVKGSGLTHLSEHVIWRGMLKRCRNPADKDYANYGGRGISVCARWLLFENFYDDMGPRPSLKHSIDRYPDKAGNYEPGNVRWATMREQNRNTRRNVLITIDGKTASLAEWAELAKVSYDYAQRRIKSGDDPKVVLFEPIPQRRGSAPICHRNSKKSHCPKGHPYSGDNLYVSPTTGYRACRTCGRGRTRKRSHGDLSRTQPLAC